MEIYEASVSLIVRAMVVSARWAARSRRLGLERACARAETGGVAGLGGHILMLEDALAFRNARLEVLEKRLGEERPRRPYPLVERLRLLWLMEYYQIPKRRAKETFGVARSSVHRWLKGFEEGREESRPLLTLAANRRTPNAVRRCWGPRHPGGPQNSAP